MESVEGESSVGWISSLADSPRLDHINGLADPNFICFRHEVEERSP